MRGFTAEIVSVASGLQPSERNPALLSPAQTAGLPGTDPARKLTVHAHAAYHDREHTRSRAGYSQTAPGNVRGRRPASTLSLLLACHLKSRPNAPASAREPPCCRSSIC